ncbi:RNA polymerase sigma factor [Anaerocolumna xylanovorans]|uniref:RNA polymerase sigma factor n=1 Tax=Anaerocolumna xylanovorans DSM 12503 TaxID=1121345 RepID=A0A1M7YFU8_9FIRM|nr:RNA polymerase sigma factor [Anaerocolumna xylanovorans]SHO51461.1 RNA polymerase sigma-70 factor, ECF subfamily [Anaerocolumna xylanovorans DSM 12503]
MGTEENDKMERIGSEAEIRKWIEKLCLDTWREVYRYIYYKVGNREEAEDITQETYARAMVYLKKEYAVVENYSAYLKAIALNIVRDEWRKQKKEPVSINIEELDLEGQEEDFTRTLEQRRALKDAMESLKEEQRRVVELRILKGYSVKETAVILKKKESHIRVLQLRALEKLAGILKENIW